MRAGRDREGLAGETLAKSIAGEITLSQNPAASMKRWRQMFNINQKKLAMSLRISPSVISDYESGRRSPGVEFVRKYTYALISLEMEKNNGLVKRLSPGEKPGAVMDMREFLTPLPAEKFLKYVEGRVVAECGLSAKNINGYTVVDSIKAILELTEKDFPRIYGCNTNRALIFTKVHLGRSPMIAIKVTKPKPSMVVLHGLDPHEVDKLAVKIAEMEQIPLIVSLASSEDELVGNLRKIEE